jgi:hypothetical protein
MNEIRKEDGDLDGTRMATLIGVSIALGIAVHKVFFLIAGAIAVGATAGAITRLAEHPPKGLFPRGL